MSDLLRTFFQTRRDTGQDSLSIGIVLADVRAGKKGPRVAGRTKSSEVAAGGPGMQTALFNPGLEDIGTTVETSSNRCLSSKIRCRVEWQEWPRFPHIDDQGRSQPQEP